MTLMNLLMRQGREGHVMNQGYEHLDTAKNVARLRGVPFLFFVGADNAVLSQAATERTYSILCETFGMDGSVGGDGEDGASVMGNKGEAREDADSEVMYRRVVVPGYGHLDGFMGKDAWRDVYPMLREEMDRVVRGREYKFVEPKDKFSKMVFNGELLY